MELERLETRATVLAIHRVAWDALEQFLLVDVLAGTEGGTQGTVAVRLLPEAAEQLLQLLQTRLADRGTGAVTVQ